MKNIFKGLASNSTFGRAVRSALWAGVSIAALPFTEAVLHYVINHPADYSAGIVGVCVFLLEAITSSVNPLVRNV